MVISIRRGVTAVLVAAALIAALLGSPKIDTSSHFVGPVTSSGTTNG